MDVLTIMEKRFEDNNYRHQNVEWQKVKLLLNRYIKQITWMEETGGEPDVVIFDNKLIVVDMVKESPKGRRSFCYDKEARINRKKFPPKSSVVEECESNQVKLVTEEIYRYIQFVEPFDLKTSSWVLTDEKIRTLGGALFCDRRYNQVFIYHNSADSYYSSRGFRTYIEL